MKQRRAKIVDHNGFQSKETDVIIYSTDIHPAILYYEKDDIGLYPAETCLYAIEVKSKANATELRDAMEKAKTLRKLQFTPGIWDPAGGSIQHQLTPIIPAFFAFDSDLKGDGKAEINRYIKLDPQGEFDPLIPVMCIVGKGYWYYRRNTTPSGDSIGKWWYWEATDGHDEVMSFLGAILNTIPDSLPQEVVPDSGNTLFQKRARQQKRSFGNWIAKQMNG